MSWTARVYIVNCSGKDVQALEDAHAQIGECTVLQAVDDAHERTCVKLSAVVKHGDQVEELVPGGEAILQDELATCRLLGAYTAWAYTARGGGVATAVVIEAPTVGASSSTSGNIVYSVYNTNCTYNDKVPAGSAQAQAARCADGVQ